MKSLDGLWTVEGVSFEAADEGGVLMLTHGQVLGGGNRFYCIGTYRQHGGIVEIDIRSFHFHGSAYSPVFGGKPDYHLHLRGRVLTEVIEGAVERVDELTVQVPFRMIWRAPLPQGTVAK